MKKQLLIACSIVLILACVFGLYSAAAGVKAALDIADYKTAEREDGLASIDMLRDGIAQLSANSDAYLEGVDAYNEGLEQFEESQIMLEEGAVALASGEEAYEDGADSLAAARAQYAAGQAELAAAKEQYAAAEAQLNQGKAEYAAGKARLDAATPAYNEGKATLATVQPIYTMVQPMYSSYLSTKAQYDAAVANGDEALAASLRPSVELQRLAFETQLSSTGYSMATLISSYEEGQAQIAEYEAAAAQLAAAKAKIDEGDAKLADAKAKIDAGEAKLNAAAAAIAAGQGRLNDAREELDEGYVTIEEGQVALADGEDVLEDGLLQLSEYEGGQELVAGGMSQLMAIEPIMKHDGKTVAVSGVADRFDSDFTYWTTDATGAVVLKNEHPYLDLKKCAKVCDAGVDFIEDQTTDVTAEVVSRIIVCALTGLASLLGLTAGALGISAAVRRNSLLKPAAIVGISAAVLAVACNIYGAATGYAGYTYPLENGDYSGAVQLTGAIILAIAAVLFAASALYARGFVRAKVAEPAAELADAGDFEAAPAAAAPAAAPAATALNEKLSLLEAQNAELREALAMLTSEIRSMKSDTAKV